MFSLPQLIIITAALVAITMKCLPYLIKNHGNSLKPSEYIPEFENPEDYGTICPTPDPFARGRVDSFADFSDMSLVSNDFYSPIDDPYRHDDWNSP